jgi:hypothetical protein
MSAPAVKRDLLITVAIWGVGIVAAVASWSGWVGLAERAGFDQSFGMDLWSWHVHPSVAWIFGICVDLFAAVAVRIWMTAHWSSVKTRKTARVWAFITIAIGVLANSTYHVLDALDVKAPIYVIVMISAVPPIMLGVVVHLAVMYGDDFRQALGSGVPAHTPTTRAPLLQRAADSVVGTVRLVKDSVRELRDGDAPAALEGRGGPPEQPDSVEQDRPTPRHAAPERRLSVLPGGESVTGKMREHYLTQRDAGWPATQGKPLTGADLDRMFGGNTLGRKVINAVREADEREEMSS